MEEGITWCKFKASSAGELVKVMERLDEYKDIDRITYKQYNNYYTECVNYNLLEKIYKGVKV